MHFAFIPYGKRSEVELLMRDMEAQKHILRMKNSDGKEKTIWIQGQVRLCPFGVVEYVFPKEDLDLILFSLITETNRYDVKNILFFAVRKLLHLKKIPEYKKDKNFLWIKDNVNIIPLGIREDCELLETEGIYKGFTHEAI